MIELVKKKEIKSIFVSLLIIALSIFLMLKPLEIVNTLIKVIGIVLLIIGVFDGMNYFLKKEEDKLFDYSLFKGIMELSVGILFIFKYDVLTSIFPIILGLIIVFINIFKLQLSLNSKSINTGYLGGVIISSLSIILGIVILMNPFETVEIVVIVSGGILLASELSNIIYSLIVLHNINKGKKIVKEIKGE